MQFSVNRRRSSDGLSVGASYTYQLVNKTPGRRSTRSRPTTGRASIAIPPASNGRRPHALTINYAYDVPNLSQKWNNIVTKAIFDNWQVSGRHDVPERQQAGLQLRLRQRADRRAERHRLDRRRRPAVPTSSATRTCRAASARFDRQFRTECVAPPTRPVPPRQHARRRIHRTRVHELGHFVLQEHPDRRRRAGSSSASSSTTRSTPISGPAVNTGGDVRLHHRRTDEHQLRQADRRDQQRAPHPARRPLHVLDSFSFRLPAPSVRPLAGAPSRESRTCTFPPIESDSPCMQAREEQPCAGSSGSLPESP